MKSWTDIPFFPYLLTWPEPIYSKTVNKDSTQEEWDFTVKEEIQGAEENEWFILILLYSSIREGKTKPLLNYPESLQSVR